MQWCKIKQVLSFTKKNVFLFSVLLLTFLLRLPSLFEPYWYGDEGIYLTLGLAMRKGLLLYRDIYDNKPPIIYLLAGLAGSQFWFRFLLFISCLFSVVIFNRLVKIFFPKNIYAQRVPLFLFSILSSVPLIEGNIANAEIFQILPIMGAVLLITQSENPSALNYFISGLLFSLAILLKIPAVFDLAAIFIFLIFFSRPKKPLHIEKKFFYLATGVLLPILAVFFFFILNRYLIEFIQIVFFQNLGYLSSWQTGSHQISLLKSNLFQKFTFVFLFMMVMYLLKKRYPPKCFFLPVWFAFSFFAVLLSGRPYAHYLIQLLPAFCLVLGQVIEGNKAFRFVSIFLIGFVLIVSFKTRFWIYPVFSYYQNFSAFFLRKKTLNSYFEYFDKKVSQSYEISNYILTHTSPDDKIFIWGDEPYIFALTRRLPAGRFTVAYHIIDFDKLKEVGRMLKEYPPKVIIFDRQKRGIFPDLENLIISRFAKIKSVRNFELFLLAN